MNELPKLWFVRTHPSGVQFRDYFSDKNCPGWSKCPYEELNILAERRIAILNAALLSQWKYKLLGWDTKGEMK